MSTAPKLKRSTAHAIFSNRGSRPARLPLLQAVYFDQTQTALSIIESDPAQINQQDPFAGLTPLHVAIFRQNTEVVRQIARHPVTNIGLKDRFGRSAADMCVYTKNEAITAAVFERAYRSALFALDHEGGGTIVPLS